jgi:rSAM/selenodomain-associated transferase 1
VKRNHHLILFAKAPRLGTVKTRLQETLPARRVRELYLAFLRDTLALARRVRGLERRVVAFTPADGEPMLRRMLGQDARGFEFRPQHHGNLGARMGSAFAQSFEAGAARVVIIGSDSPTLPTRMIEEAFAALENADLVLGPTTDGGYYLIGSRQPRLPGGLQFLAGPIEWSTARVFEQTVRAARRRRLKLALLAPWYDVDDAAGLAVLRRHLRALAACGASNLPIHTLRSLRRRG